MSDPQNQRQRRPRLGADERARLLAEIAKFDTVPPRPAPAARSAPISGDRAEITATEQAARAALIGDAADMAELPRVVDVWSNLLTIPVDPRTLARNLVITASREDPAHAAFDVLRTRLVQALAEHGRRRVGITSPTRDCGKTFTAVNLAITLSRYDNCRTVLMDMDLRNPTLARRIGANAPQPMGDFLRGQIPTEAFLRRLAPNDLNIGGNLAFGLNGRIEPYAAELFQQQSTTDVLARLQEETEADVMLFDLPPAMAQDDVIAFRPHFDCILMVVGGGITKASDVRESIRRLGEDKPVIGIVLNKAEGEGVDDYSY